MNNFNLNGDKIGALKLSSIKTPRDLSLGGCGPIKSKPNKKVYTPNVNVTRQKTTDVKTSKDTTRKVRNKFERNNKYDRNNRNSNNFVQTLGVFSEGIGASFKKSHSVSDPNSRKREDSKSRRQTPHQNGKIGKIDKKAEQRRLNDILGESDTDEEECEFMNLKNHPVKLIKGDGIEQLGTLKINQNGIDHKNEDIKKFFDSTTPQVFLLQFPDNLPCEKSDETPIDINGEEPVYKKSSMSMLQEGQVGKVVRYKSGKQKLILGNTIFDVNLGMEAKFLQQLISLETRREERSGDIINMGNVSLKLTATPDWNSLLSS